MTAAAFFTGKWRFPLARATAVLVIGGVLCGLIRSRPVPAKRKTPCPCDPASPVPC